MPKATKQNRAVPRLEQALHLAMATAIASLSGAESAATALTAAPPQTRCGWYSNPGPANHYLFDREGRWVIGEQGGPPARGFNDVMPELRYTPSDWVERNVGAYGYGCLCLGVAADRGSMRINRVYSVRQRSLATCRADRALPPFETGPRPR